MPKHSETRHLPYSAEQMYALVADVARYAEFLPWVTAVRVRSESDTEMVADLLVGFSGLRERCPSKVAKQAPSQDANNEEPVTVKVIVKLKSSSGSGLDQAPVDVRLEQRRAKHVLTIPVTALLARQGGTFAVEVRQGTTRRIVPVETGLFTSGLVEIEGAGLTPGMRVTDAEV